MAFFLLVLFATALSAPALSTPSVSAAVTQKGLTAITDVLVPQFEKQVASIDLPDISFNKDQLEASISSIVCSGISLGASNLDIVGDALVFSSPGVNVQCKAHYSYKMSFWPHEPRGAGDVDATVGGSLSASVSVVSLNDMPSVNLPSCSTNVGLTHLSFSGGVTSAILELFKSEIKSEVASQANAQICKQLTNFVSTGLDPLLQKLTTAIDLPIPPPYNIVELDYAYPSSAVFEDGFVLNALAAEVYRKNHRSEPPFKPTPVPQKVQTAGSSSMVDVYMNAFIANSASYVFFQAGLLKAQYVGGNIEQLTQLDMSTSAFSDSLPMIDRLWPKSKLAVAFEATAMPVFSFTPSGIALEAPMLVDVQTDHADFRLKKKLVSMGVILHADAKATVENGKVKIALEYVKTESVKLHSMFDALKLHPMDDLINTVLKHIVVPKINKKIPQIPLPTLEGLVFVNSTVDYRDGCIRVATDMDMSDIAIPWQVADGGGGEIVIDLPDGEEIVIVENDEEQEPTLRGGYA